MQFLYWLFCNLAVEKMNVLQIIEANIFSLLDYKKINTTQKNELYRQNFPN